MQRAIASRPPPVSAPPPPPSPEPTSPAPASTVTAEPARKRRRHLITPAEYAVFRQVRGLLQARYPQIFSWGRPLAIGIDQRLREAFTEEELPTADLKVFLRIWVRRKAYRAVLARGERRVNLDGSDAGPAFGDQPEAPPGLAPNVSAGGC
jgi:sRNA-binding protein